MSRSEVVDFIARYARASRPPLRTRTRVTRVMPVADGYRVITDRGEWLCRCLVIASGAFNSPVVPGLAAALPARLASLNTHQYRNPDQLNAGGVLVVGAAASGLQIADEIQRSGRQVTLAVGEHVRMPRLYRGRDILYWMHVTGLLDERYSEVEDITRVRKIPSPQLIGSNEKHSLDLNTLSGRGVQLVGRVTGLRGQQLQFSGALSNLVKLADLKQARLLAGIDQWIEARGLDTETPLEAPPAPTRLAASPRLDMDLGSGEIGTVIWATGFRPDYSWLQVPVLDRKGWIRHQGGVGETPGLYVMGLPFMRRRKSSFLFGADDDAREICAHLVAYLAGTLASGQAGQVCRRA
jgi:putative flavoprotein involved in K+ transport